MKKTLTRFEAFCSQKLPESCSEAPPWCGLTATLVVPAGKSTVPSSPARIAPAPPPMKVKLMARFVSTTPSNPIAS